ncbi:MAG: hypothetical protein LBQ38_11890 [Spirochaetaceae bacterium]|nr:hypothetical protein [Spirochaetaceae bacterium]
MLVIIFLVILWYGLVPVVGAFVTRHNWRVFRRRFDDLRLRPFLDYRAYRQGAGGKYRFIGGFESLTDGKTLWIRNDELTIPVSLAGAHTYVLPMQEQGEDLEAFDPGEETPERIRWDRVSALNEGAKVFVGGYLLPRDARLTFLSTRDHPLLVIFYDGPDRSLTIKTIRAGRHKNEYWNGITPYAFILGTFSQILMAVNYLFRPAFRLTVITALVALFTPLFPLIPPGILFTILYQRLRRRARLFRAYRDLARLPLRYLYPDSMDGLLPDGEPYGVRYYPAIPPGSEGKRVPLLVPEEAAGRHRGWYIVGALPEQPPEGAGEPREPRDPFATFGAIPGKPETLARGFTLKAYLLEIGAWSALLAGIGLNIFFISAIIAMIFLQPA